jgi:replicative DNA helicase
MSDVSDAEESVIGAVLVHPRRIADLADTVRADDFHHPALRAIFESMLALASVSKPVDAVTVLHEMRTRGTFDHLAALKGGDYLVHLMANVVTTENIAYHAGIVRTKARRRRFGARLRDLTARAFGDDADDEFFAAVEEGIREITRDDPAADATIPVRQVAYDWLRDYEAKAQASQRGEVLRFVPTGVRSFDANSGGVRPGEILTIAARPGRGKSSFMNFMLAQCGVDGVPGLCITYEMPPADLFARLVSSDAGIDGSALRVPRMHGATLVRITQSAARAAEWPLWYICRPDMRVDELRAVARRWRRENDGANAVVAIDFVQLVRAGLAGKGVTREREVAHVCEQVDAMALELSCAVVLLAQLNRETAKRGGAPRMSDIRESGAVEVVSDVIWAIHMPELDEAEEDPSKPQPESCVAWMTTLKGRSVKGGAIKMIYEPIFTRFRNPEYGE